MLGSAPSLGDDHFDINYDVKINILGRGYSYIGMTLAGLYFLDLNHDMGLNVMSIGFRASPESHSFFTFGTIY